SSAPPRSAIPLRLWRQFSVRERVAGTIGLRAGVGGVASRRVAQPLADRRSRRCSSVASHALHSPARAAA
ncbi:MAG TPA: hypothetical protein DEB06_11160, partial [Phycisphaerales bacterium]|nr:hypothetical protein [Phycisphaerales bacterium]